MNYFVEDCKEFFWRESEDPASLEAGSFK